MQCSGKWWCDPDKVSLLWGIQRIGFLHAGKTGWFQVDIMWVRCCNCGSKKNHDGIAPLGRIPSQGNAIKFFLRSWKRFGCDHVGSPLLGGVFDMCCWLVGTFGSDNVSFLRRGFCAREKLNGLVAIMWWANCCWVEGEQVLSGLTPQHSWKKCFCLREPVFWGGNFLIWTRIFLILRRNFPNELS